MSQSRSLPAKVRRLERKVARQKGDLMQETYAATTGTEITTGYHEARIGLINADMLANTNGNFIIEKVEYRVRPPSGAAYTSGSVYRVDLLVPQEDQALPTTDIFGDVNNIPAQKFLKSYKSTWGICAYHNDRYEVEESVRTGLVVRVNAQNQDILRNNHWLVIRWDQRDTNSHAFQFDIAVYYREKA